MKIIHESENCKVYLWGGLSGDDEGDPVTCDPFLAVEVQAEGMFTKAILEGTCGGEWETIHSFPFPGIASVTSKAWKFRPRIEGSDKDMANIYLVVRR